LFKKYSGAGWEALLLVIQSALWTTTAPTWRTWVRWRPGIVWRASIIWRASVIGLPSIVRRAGERRRPHTFLVILIVVIVTTASAEWRAPGEELGRMHPGSAHDLTPAHFFTVAELGQQRIGVRTQFFGQSKRNHDVAKAEAIAVPADNRLVIEAELIRNCLRDWM
jgi:hypothetical protein